MRPRVLAVTNMYPTQERPGYGTFVASNVSALRAAGFDVDVLFVDGRTRRGNYLSAFRRVRERIQTARFDLVHAHYGLTGLFCLAQSLPLVVSYYGSDLLGDPDPRGRGGSTMKGRVGVAISQFVARRADGIAVESEEMRLRLRRAIDRERAKVIPAGIDVSMFKVGSKERARAILGWPADAKVVLFPNTPHIFRKRLDLAEAAVARLRSGGINAELRIVRGIRREEMPLRFQAADCTLLCSEWEGSPNVVKESLACAVPVVSTEVGDVRRWASVVDGIHLVDRNVESIAQGLKDALGRREPPDVRVYRSAISHLRTASAFELLYAEVLTRSAKRGVLGREDRAPTGD